jgi:hypothetical protein
MNTLAIAVLLLLSGAALGAVPSPIPRGTLDPGAPVKPMDEALRSLELDRIAAPVLERYEAGDYEAAARLGLEIVTREPTQHALRLAVANSLAWTARYDEAAAHYRELFGTSYDLQARVGLADVHRWRGQAHLAEPLYLEALAREPGNAGASEGIALAARELRPALTLRGSRTEDNELLRDELSLAYRRWSADRRWRLEAGAFGDREQSALGEWWPRALFASAWSPALPLSPQLDLSWYESDLRSARLFGTLQLEPIRDRLKLRAGRLDWGRTAFSPAGSRDGLTANTFGLSGEAPTRAGTVRGRADLYDISDDNRIIVAEAQITPLWQPLPWRVRWIAGVYGRDAEREDPRYWSPSRPAYGVAFAGLERHWSSESFELSASVRRGLGLTTSAGDSWSAGLNGRVWLTRELAVGVEAWGADAPRPGNYRVYHVGLSLQRLL